MGRYLEVLKERPPEGATWEERRALSVKEVYPHAALELRRCLRGAGRAAFPMLWRVGYDSEEYVNESLWLDAEEAGTLLAEIQRVRRVCRREEFVHGIDGMALWEAWSTWREEGETDALLDEIEGALALAVGRGYVVHVML